MSLPSRIPSPSPDPLLWQERQRWDSQRSEGGEDALSQRGCGAGMVPGAGMVLGAGMVPGAGARCLWAGGWQRGGRPLRAPAPRPAIGIVPLSTPSLEPGWEGPGWPGRGEQMILGSPGAPPLHPCRRWPLLKGGSRPQSRCDPAWGQCSLALRRLRRGRVSRGAHRPPPPRCPRLLAAPGTSRWLLCSTPSSTFGFCARS